MMADHPNPKIESEAEVFALARERLGLVGEEVLEIMVQLLERKQAAAAARGLTAKWSRTFGFITMHDSTTGEYHDIPTKDAPAWAKWEAGKRKMLWRAGHRNAFDLTSAQMAQIWATEHPPPEEGIVEEHPLED
jgi:hypothetical protein